MIKIMYNKFFRNFITHNDVWITKNLPVYGINVQVNFSEINLELRTEAKHFTYIFYPGIAGLHVVCLQKRKTLDTSDKLVWFSSIFT